MARPSVPAVAALLAAGAFLAACASGPPEAVAPLDLAAFFDGHARSRGTIATALVFRKPFTADFAGRREGEAFALDERFHFAEGDRLQRWRLARTGSGGYAGTVETEGRNGRLHAPVRVSGSADADGGVVLVYRGYAPGGDALLRFRHRMALQADGTVLNRVRVSKFGVPLAGARVVFERVPNGAK